MEDITGTEQPSDFLFYTGEDGKTHIQVIVGKETVWLSEKKLAELFNVDRSVINKHISNIYSEKELIHEGTCAIFAQVQIEGKRSVKRDIVFYNLDVIIAVGYRVNSYQATRFRIWATKILNEYLTKGFVLDSERLKKGSALFGEDHFEELLQRIREIRASERRFYQKITDLYALSEDYDKSSPITREFYAFVQNKLEFAITNHTAAEIIKIRANADSPHMGLQTWSNPNGKIIKKDIIVTKNYLTESELDELNRIVNMYLDYAENQAKRHKIMKMTDWISKLDAFLKFNDYDILTNAGKVSKELAEAHAVKEYGKFRINQDIEYVSDFDKVVNDIKNTGLLPNEDNITKPKTLKKDKKTSQKKNKKS